MVPDEHRRRRLGLADHDLHRVDLAAVLEHSQLGGGGVDDDEAAARGQDPGALEVGQEARVGGKPAAGLHRVPGRVAQLGIDRIDGGDRADVAEQRRGAGGVDQDIVGLRDFRREGGVAVGDAGDGGLEGADILHPGGGQQFVLGEEGVGRVGRCGSKGRCSGFDPGQRGIDLAGEIGAVVEPVERRPFEDRRQQLGRRQARGIAEPDRGVGARRVISVDRRGRGQAHGGDERGGESWGGSEGWGGGEGCSGGGLGERGRGAAQQCRRGRHRQCLRLISHPALRPFDLRSLTSTAQRRARHPGPVIGKIAAKS